MKKTKDRKVSVIILLTILVSVVATWGVLRTVEPPAYSETKKPHNHSEDEQKELWTCGMHPWIITEEPGLCPICNMELTLKRDDPAGNTASAAERRILYWRSPSNPMEISENPGKGKSGEDLVPVYEDEFISGVEVKIDPVTRQNMGLRTAEVIKAPLSRTIRTYGHITFNETRTTRVSPKYSGWIEKLHINFTGEFVKKGDPLFDIYSPELLTAQEELLSAYRTYRSVPNEANKDFLESARRRLEFFDVGPDEIKAIRDQGKVRKTLTIRSPFSGVVIEKNAMEGGFIKAGTHVFTISDLSRVWVEAHIYEFEMPLVHQGIDAEMSLPYLPGKTFLGKVAFIYPYLQKKTRDVIIRLEFENPGLELKPDMYADIRIQTGGSGSGIVIPSESVIRSGERNVVFVERDGGKFTPRNVALGIPLDHGNIQVLEGLLPGESIVTSGQFLLDSESKLKEAIQKMMEAKRESPAKKETGDDFFDDMDNGGDFFKDMEG